MLKDVPQLHQHQRLKERVGSAPALGASDGALAGEQMRTAALLSKSASADSGLFFRSSSREAPKKKVRFSNVTNVILVPTRQDYFDHNLDKKLWWTENDYDVFKKSAVREVSALINIYRIDAKTALARLGLGELAGEVTAKAVAVECAPSLNSSISDSNLQLLLGSEASETPSTSSLLMGSKAGGSNSSGGNYVHPSDDGAAAVNHRNQLASASASSAAALARQPPPSSSSRKAAESSSHHAKGLLQQQQGCTEAHTSINALPASAVRLPSPKRGNGASSSSSEQMHVQGGISLGLGVTPKSSSALHPLAYMAGF